MGRLPSRVVLFLLALTGSAAIARRTGAQAPADGAQRLWLELGLGGSRQDPNCAACAQRSTIGGPSVSIAAGLTITPRFGVGVLARQFAEFSFDYSHSATYYLGLAQFTPGTRRVIVFNAGLGVGQQHGDQAPYGDNGSGTVAAAGIALRVPPGSIFGLTLTADLIKSMTGTVTPASGRAGSTYRPLLFTIGLGLNIAGESMTPKSAR
jgi:hypothetical protein